MVGIPRKLWLSIELLAAPGQPAPLKWILRGPNMCVRWFVTRWLWCNKNSVTDSTFDSIVCRNFQCLLQVLLLLLLCHSQWLHHHAAPLNVLLQPHCHRWMGLESVPIYLSCCCLIIPSIFCWYTSSTTTTAGCSSTPAGFLLRVTNSFKLKSSPDLHASHIVTSRDIDEGCGHKT